MIIVVVIILLLTEERWMHEAESVELVVGGARIRLRKADVLRAVREGPLGAIRQHAVEIEKRLYPVKEVFARATGVDVLDFNTAQARTSLRRLGFQLRTVSPLGRRRHS
jgi:sugar (pentulose or hexulose) kinase